MTKRHSNQYIFGVGVFSGMKPLKDHIAVTVRAPAQIIVHEVTALKYRAGFFEAYKPDAIAAAVDRTARLARRGSRPFPSRWLPDVYSIEGLPIVGPIDHVLHQVFERFESCVEHFEWRHMDGSPAVCPSSRLTLLGYPDRPTGNSGEAFR
jgi:hypothetical protein